MKEFHILNLGAGVQSTRLYMMYLRGEIEPQIDAAICSDVQEEPEAVYRHLEWLKSLNGPPILVRTKGRLGHDLIHGCGPTKRAASIPAFTLTRKPVGNHCQDGFTRPTELTIDEVGKVRRQCSQEYKAAVINSTIRQEILGLRPGQRIPRGVKVHQYFGISMDECGRARRITELFKKKQKWATPHFPLVERFITRADCLTYLADKVPHQTPRSACVFCPFHSDAEWYRIKHEDPTGWARAVEIDHALRDPNSVVNRDMRQTMYLHRSCKPLELVQLDTRPKPRDLQLSMSFAAECMGMCGV